MALRAIQTQLAKNGHKLSLDALHRVVGEIMLGETVAEVQARTLGRRLPRGR